MLFSVDFTRSIMKSIIKAKGRNGSLEGESPQGFLLL